MLNLPILVKNYNALIVIETFSNVANFQIKYDCFQFEYDYSTSIGDIFQLYLRK